MARDVAVGTGLVLSCAALTGAAVGAPRAVRAALEGTGVSCAGSGAGSPQASSSGAARINPPAPAASRSSSLRPIVVFPVILRAVCSLPRVVQVPCRIEPRGSIDTSGTAGADRHLSGPRLGTVEEGLPSGSASRSATWDVR